MHLRCAAAHAAQAPAQRSALAARPYPPARPHLPTLPCCAVVQEAQHAKILPAVMGLMDDFSAPRVQAHACAAVVNFAGAARRGAGG